MYFRHESYFPFLDQAFINKKFAYKRYLILLYYLIPDASGNILGASEWNTGYPSSTAMYPTYGALQPPYYKPDPTLHIPPGKEFF